MNRRSMIGKLGGAGIASALVIGNRGGISRTAAQAGTIVLVVHGTIAVGRNCGETFIANIEINPETDGLINSGVFQLAEMSAELPFLELGAEYPLVGTFDGRTLDMRVAAEDDRYLTFHGVANIPSVEALVDDSGLDVAGTFAGTVGCEMGTWTTILLDDSEWCDGCGCCEECVGEEAVKPVPTQTPAATETPIATPGGTPTATPTATPTETPTVTPTPVTCPAGAVWDGQACVCADPDYELVNDRCVPVCWGSAEHWVGYPDTVDLDRELCPPRGIPNIATDVCVCDEGYVRSNGACVVADDSCTPMEYCGTSEHWSAQYNRCVCDDNYARDLNGQCVVAIMCDSVIFDGVEYVCQ